MSKISCPNCGISCVGCAGARLTAASDGKQCCSKCVAAYNAKLKTQLVKPNS